MPDASQLSDAKRALLDRYLRGDLPPPAPKPNGDPRPVRREAVDSLKDVVEIQRGSGGRPFFFLHGQWKLGGFACFRLARALGADRPFYALEPYPLESKPAGAGLEDVASAHLRSLRSVQPEGPYMIGGWCNGGLLAYEMARQLQAAGQTVELLLLMDPIYLVYPLHNRLARAALGRLGRVARFGDDRQMALYLWLRQGYRHLWHAYRYLRSADYRRATPFSPLGREDYPGIYDWTAVGYVPEPLYGGKVTIICSSGQPYRRGWQRVESAGEVDVHVLPFPYERFWNQDLDKVAEHVRERVAEAEAGRPAEPAVR